MAVYLSVKTLINNIVRDLDITGLCTMFVMRLYVYFGCEEPKQGLIEAFI